MAASTRARIATTATSRTAIAAAPSVPSRSGVTRPFQRRRHPCAPALQWAMPAIPARSGGVCADACTRRLTIASISPVRRALTRQRLHRRRPGDGVTSARTANNTDPCDDDDPAPTPMRAPGGSCTGTPAPALGRVACHSATCWKSCLDRRQDDEQQRHLQLEVDQVVPRLPPATSATRSAPIGYVLCVYDEPFGGTPSLLMSATIPPAAFAGRFRAGRAFVESPAGTTGLASKDDGWRRRRHQLDPQARDRREGQGDDEGKGTSLVLPGENAHAALAARDAGRRPRPAPLRQRRMLGGEPAAGGVVKNQADKLNLKSE